ncbi:hypothetical protein K1719_029973 [Acacia pycnantha]|nr:hypothetical protein K1719_029973 [Acacia pycnantha]
MRWDYYALESLPPVGQLHELESLRLCKSKIRKLWNGAPALDKLRIIDLSDSKCLEIPDFSGTPNLEELLLNRCRKLVQVHESVGQLKKLVKLNLQECRRLENLPTLQTDKLEELILSGCSKLEKLPKFGRKMGNLYFLDVTGTDITEIPLSIIRLSNLKCLDLTYCRRLKSIPKLPPNVIISASNVACWNPHPLYHISMHLVLQRVPFTFSVTSNCGQESQHADIPSNVVADSNEEHWGIAVCVVFQFLSKAWLGFSVKWLFEDKCHPKKTKIHGTPAYYMHDCRVYMGFYPFQAKDCRQHGEGRQLHLTLEFPATNIIQGLHDLEIMGCGWRLACKKDFDEWSENRAPSPLRLGFHNRDREKVAIIPLLQESEKENIQKFYFNPGGAPSVLGKCRRLVTAILPRKIHARGDSVGPTQPLSIRARGRATMLVAAVERLGWQKNSKDVEEPVLEVAVEYRTCGFVSANSRLQDQGVFSARHETEIAEDILSDELPSNFEHFVGDTHETEIAEDILSDELPSNFEHFVGDTQSKVDRIISHSKMGLEDTCFIGIWGERGIGKTTLARLVYDEIQSKFDATCFLDNIREVSERDGIVSLQKKLLSGLRLGERDIDNSFEGAKIIRRFLCHKKVLIILDDISQISQLENLAGNKEWFGAGSKIVITTRDKTLLKVYEQFEEYGVGRLHPDESLKLLCQEAFKKEGPQEGFWDLSQEVIKHVCGLPLVLKVLGSYLCKKDKNEWRKASERLRKFHPLISLVNFA